MKISSILQNFSLIELLGFIYIRDILELFDNSFESSKIVCFFTIIKNVVFYTCFVFIIALIVESFLFYFCFLFLHIFNPSYILWIMILIRFNSQHTQRKIMHLQKKKHNFLKLFPSLAPIRSHTFSLFYPFSPNIFQLSHGLDNLYILARKKKPGFAYNCLQV